MKKSVIYAVLLLATAACTDDLDQYPNTETTSADLYQNVGQYESVLAKAYASFVIAGQEKGGTNADISSNSGHDLLRGLFNLQESCTDELMPTWLDGDNLNGLTFFSWDANDPWVSDVYYRLYYTISLCNEFLRQDISSFSASDVSTLQTYHAEARFLRAFAYYWVLDLYRKGPLQTEANEVGAYVPQVADAQGLFDFIESELKECSEAMLSRADAVYGRAPRAAAWILLSRLYLNAEVYTGVARYSDVITYAQKVIDEGYTLAPSYASLFNADNHKRTEEIIFHAVVDADEVVSWGASTYTVCGAVSNSSTSESYNSLDYGVKAGWGSFRSRSALPGLFEATDDRAMFYTDGQTLEVVTADNASEGYLVCKWTNLTDDGEVASNTSDDGVDTDWPMFRLPEAYLNLAEAVVRGGTGATLSDALALVNALRERSGASAKYESDISLRFLLDERGREFYWEALRRTDLVRYGMLTSSDYSYDLKPSTVADKYNYFPIPQSELTANPNLSNPEY